MKYKVLLIAIFLTSFGAIFSSVAAQKKNVGLLIVATGKYIGFVSELLASAEQHFCTKHNVTYFIFTDGNFPTRNNVVTIYQDRLGWPYDTLMRYSFYDTHREKLKKMDYLFATDADMLFVDTIGDEILSDRVATQHPGFFSRRGTYEKRGVSTACVGPAEEKYYFAGGFNGGSRKEFLKMARVITQNIQKDLQNGIIAIWNDESHINRYFIDNTPTCILSPSYCYPENWDTPQTKRQLAYPENWKVPFQPRLIARDKVHSQYQVKA